MRYAYCINAGDDFNAVIDLACEAEQAGWDGFFVPDGIAIDVPNLGPFPLFDPWVVLGRSRRVRPAFVSAP
jgi:alkanesulfonate monooxygenase SsuD/methylene tetrahydromethanopterin reductase-like flavin-dependent oxidoreductase (luciferase family)